MESLDYTVDFLPQKEESKQIDTFGDILSYIPEATIQNLVSQTKDKQELQIELTVFLAPFVQGQKLTQKDLPAKMQSLLEGLHIDHKASLMTVQQIIFLTA